MYEENKLEESELEEKRRLLKQFCGNGFVGEYLTYHPSHRHERTVTGNDMLEAMQIN